jgi:DNA-binding MarR family transcriptional regulator
MSNTLPATSRSLEFCINLAKAHAALTRRFDGGFATLHGISFGDFVLLLHLNRAPGGKLRRVDLAEEVGLTPSAVTRSLIPLERIGLVTRQRDLRDARVGYAVITKAGQRILQEAMSSAELASEHLVRGSGELELRRLSELLVQIGR